VLVLDNLRVHHLTELREWLARRGIEVLFLFPYSLDFTPIEQAWSKLKTKLRHVPAKRSKNPCAPPSNGLLAPML
jgi:transposase